MTSNISQKIMCSRVFDRPRTEYPDKVTERNKPAAPSNRTEGKP